MKNARNNSFLVPILAIVLMGSAALWFWHKAQSQQQNELQPAQDQLQKNLALASYNLGKDIADVEMLKMKDPKSGDAIQIDQKFAEIGAALGVLKVRIDYKGLDYRPMGPTSAAVSNACQFIGTQLDAGTTEQITEYFALGHQLQGMEAALKLNRYEYFEEVNGDLSTLNTELRLLAYPQLVVQLTPPAGTQKWDNLNVDNMNAVAHSLDSSNEQVLRSLQ